MTRVIPLGEVQPGSFVECGDGCGAQARLGALPEGWSSRLRGRVLVYVCGTCVIEGDSNGE